MNIGKALIVVVFVAAAAGIFFYARGGGATAGAASTAGGTSPGTDQTEIVFLYSTEKKEWVEACASAFKAQEPGIKVTLQGQGSLDAAQALLDAKAKPTLWSPADSSVLALTDSDYRTRNGNTSLWAIGGALAPQPLVLTPLVWVAWEDRADVLQKSGGGVVNWKSIHSAVASPQGWPAVGGKPDWGFVKLGHTDPTRSNSGVQALLLMTLEYYGKRRGLEVGDVLKPEYQTFVKETEKGVTRFETSTGTFMTEMVLYGPSKYDIAVVYENLAIAQVENARGRWGNLKIYYPALTVWSDHPIVLIDQPWVTPAQQAAARKWVDFLRARPQQELALRFGFRPSDPTVPLKSADPSNPFNRLAGNGVKVDLPPVADTPDGAVVRALLTMWSRLVAK